MNNHWKRALIGTMFFVFSFLGSSAFSSSCQEVFPNAAQSHSPVGKISFGWGADLVNTPSSSIQAVSLTHGGDYAPDTCSDQGEHCLVSGEPSGEFTIDEFQTTGNGSDLSVGFMGDAVVAQNTNSKFGVVSVGTFGELKIEKQDQAVHIDQLNVNYRSKLILSEGDYWINRIGSFSSQIAIEVEGEGTVRIFLNDNIDFGWNSKINYQENGIQQPEKLFVYSTKNIEISSSSYVAGYFYARELINVNSFASFYGAASAKDLKLSAYASIRFVDHIALTNFNAYCDGGLVSDLDEDGIPDHLDGDIDGDGYNNDIEIEQGTDPRDFASQPTNDGSNEPPPNIGDEPSACKASFENGLQIHGAAQAIDFSYNAQLINGSSSGLKTASVLLNGGSSKLSCVTEVCYALGDVNEPLVVPTFIASTKLDTLKIKNKEQETFGLDDETEFPKIELRNQAEVTFAPNENDYVIRELLVGNKAKIYLAPGNYWIGKLEFKNQSELHVDGNGTVRLFVNENLNLRNKSKLNIETDGTGNANQLFIYSYSSVEFANEVKVAALIYTQESLELKNKAELLGGALAEKIKLNNETKVYYQSNAVDSIDFGPLCESEPNGDNDGDGYSNVIEIQVGTDPNDPDSKPNDIDGDFIPDELDEDKDGDSYNNDVDVFPSDPLEWSDLDSDGIGNNSDPDRDGDGISNVYEIHVGSDPDDPSNTPPDLDADGIPDSIDTDRDGDTYENENDSFPDDASEWSDLDNDGTGDNSDLDRDGDGVSNDYETQLGFDPNDATNTPPDIDSDGIPDSLDSDRDGDGYENASDVFPDDATEWADLDNDGTGDNSDIDRDGDGISNDYETQTGFDPNDASSTPPDLDSDGIPDSLDDDRDGDSYENDNDVFPDDATEWADLDGDGTGDNSDADRDGDGISNENETELGFDPNDANNTPPDLDGDGIPDSLDSDRDGDSYENETDAFPDDASEWADLDNDGTGDNSDLDRDGDGVSNDYETQLGFDPNDPSNTPSDLDSDGIPDSVDSDRDGDSYENDADVFPDDANEWSDLDTDGTGDNSDLDRDGDGISNDYETQAGFDPNDASSTPPDLDSDGIPDSLDFDRDGDSYQNDADAFPDDASEWSDIDRDGIGDNSDADRDGDGINNDYETQLGFDPNDSTNTPPDLDADGIPNSLDSDRDGDGYENENDSFPEDSSEWADLDNDGTGDNSDTDRDGDGINNEYETQAGFDPNDATSTPPDLDSDGIPDSLDNDRDGDSYENENDSFPNDASEWSDLDNDGVGDNSDTDRDGDGVSNEYETETGFDPNDATNTPPDLDSDGIPDSLDNDRDGDSYDNESDKFPDDASEWADLDNDGIGDNSDADRDGDGISNDYETQLGFDPNDQTSSPPDLDSDGIPDSLDSDRDGDSYENSDDAFPDDSSEWADLDNDGIGNNTDPDRDGDQISNEDEIALGFDPDDPEASPPDFDGDSIPDDLDADKDNDGYANDNDAFPYDASEWSDIDNDGIGDNKDTERDGDGFDNAFETERGTDPNDPTDYPDTVAPYLLIQNPTTNSRTENVTVIISGVFTDTVQPRSGVEQLYAKSTQFPAADYQAVLNNGEFTVEVPLVVGLNTINLNGVDLSGNTISSDITIDRDSPPKFMNVTPVSGSLLVEDTVTISGQVFTLLPLSDVAFYINEWFVTPQGTTTQGVYNFEQSNIPLSIGANVFELRVVTKDGETSQNISVEYRPEDADSLEPPKITIQSPVNGRTLNEESFRIGLNAQSYAGGLTLIINGDTANPIVDANGFIQLSQLVSFASGESILNLDITAIDSLDKETNVTATYYLDSQKPEITVNNAVSMASGINTVSQSPYEITGQITDNNLVSFSANGRPMTLQPNDEGTGYNFQLSVDVPRGIQTPVNFSAADDSGNTTQLNYIFENTAPIGIEALTPGNGAELLSNGTDGINVQVAARLDGISTNANVRVSVANDAELSSQTLDINGTLSSGEIQLPAESGAYTITYQVISDGQIIATTTTQLSVLNEQDIPVTLTAHEPAVGEINIEPNQALELYFNKVIDPTKLQVTLRETLHGKTYLDLDPAGTDFLNAQGYQLTDVHRDNELVTGAISVLPDNKTFVFYPSRQFGFNADLLAEVMYDGEELARFTFKIRALPTFIMGGVVDQFGQPLSGINVSLPDSDRSTQTNGDGLYSFGFQEAAGNEIPSGPQRLLINPDINNPRYGVNTRNINVQTGFKNELGISRLQELHPEAPFQLIASGQGLTSFAGDELRMDLSDARVLFNNGRNSGSVQYQFLPFEQLDAQQTPGAHPQWMFAGQPRGTKVEGEVELDIKMPTRQSTYDYAPSIFKYVVLLAYNADTEVIAPVGIGEIENYRVKSIGKVSIQSLDFIGYAWIDPKYQPLLQQVAEGTLSMQQLISALQE